MLFENYKQDEESGSIRLIPIKAIDPSPYQPRIEFGDIEELKESIKRSGQTTPVVLMPAPNNNGRFQLLSGERRWRALKLLRRKEIRAECRKDLEEEKKIRRFIYDANKEKPLTTTEEIPSRAYRIDLVLCEMDDFYSSITYDDLPERKDLSGELPLDRLATLLREVNSCSLNKKARKWKGTSKGGTAKRVFIKSEKIIHKFVNILEQAFKKETLGKIKWRTFWEHDFSKYLVLDGEIKEIAVKKKLNKSQVEVLTKIKKDDDSEGKKVYAEAVAKIDKGGTEATRSSLRETASKLKKKKKSKKKAKIKKSDIITADEKKEMKRIEVLVGQVVTKMNIVRGEMDEFELLKKGGSRYKKVLKFMLAKGYSFQKLREGVVSFSSECEWISNHLDRLSGAFT